MAKWQQISAAGSTSGGKTEPKSGGCYSSTLTPMDLGDFILNLRAFGHLVYISNCIVQDSLLTLCRHSFNEQNL